MNVRLRLLYIVLLFLPLSAALAADQLQLEVLDHEFVIDRFKAEAGRRSERHLIISISPGFGNNERTEALARKLAGQGIEFWHVDLLDNLFIPKSTNALRERDGRYVAELIRQAHETTGRKITLMTRAYGALPVLRGARQWQLQYADTGNVYLLGAILFSPEFYSRIPSLGLEPVYDPIVAATNIPIMFYQAGKRGNRWQLDKSLERLGQGGAKVYLKVLPGVTGVFYHEDEAQETSRTLEELPNEIPRVLSMLEKTPTPTRAVAMDVKENRGASGLDLSLKPFAGALEPLPIKLRSTTGEVVEINDYEGRVTVLNFWASWCPPCVEEIPALNRLRERMQGKAFELISVNYSQTPRQVQEFLSMVDVDFPVLLDEDGRFTAAWNVLVYPSTFIISPEGVIVYGVNGAIEWDSDEVVSALEALLSS